MRDLLPAEAAGFDRLEAIILARALRYGFPRISTPIVEDREVFAKTSGEDSDVVGHEMYAATLGTEGKAMAMRPEGTAPVTRALLQHGLHRAPRPIRLSYFEPMFRGQRPQLLRYRQFWQWGLECDGAEEPSADVEIVEFTNGFFADVGLTRFDLQVNTVGDAACRPKVVEALAAYFTAQRDALSDASQRRLSSNVLRILDSKDPRDRAVIKGAPDVHALLCADDRAHFDAVVAGLDRLGIRHRVVPTLVRGLDYYTRTVYEFVLTDPEFTKAGDIAVAAGGRYDELMTRMGGPAFPGVGIAGGVDVLYYALKQEGVALPREPLPEVWVLSGQTDDVADRIQLASPLRDAGFRVAIEYSTRPLERQLENAVKHGAKVAVIRGTEEARGGHVIVRDLEKKEQRVTRLAAVVVEVGRHAPRYAMPKLLGEGGSAGAEG
jgi:histidyl-tRNA synthetase